MSGPVRNQPSSGGQPEQVVCPNCKGGNPVGAAVCMWCGAALNTSATVSLQQPVARYAPPPQQYTQPVAHMPLMLSQQQPQQPQTSYPHQYQQPASMTVPAQTSVVINNANNIQASPSIVIIANNGPGCLVRGLYFLFIGWWATFFWINLAWLFNALIIGLPLGLTMLNRVPQVMTLSPGSKRLSVQQIGNVTLINTSVPQVAMSVRIIYFIFLGWWLSFLWTYMAYILALTIIGLPLSFVMFNVIGFITTLRRN